jgi:antitoxin ParD1/3/4
MNVSLPDELKQFVDGQVDAGGYGSTSEFIRALIRREQERQQLRALLIDGATSPLAGPADTAFFATLRARVASAD